MNVWLMKYINITCQRLKIATCVWLQSQQKQSDTCTCWKILSYFAASFYFYHWAEFIPSVLLSLTLYISSLFTMRESFLKTKFFSGAAFLKGELLLSQGQRRSLCCGEATWFIFSHFHCEWSHCNRFSIVSNIQ